MAIKRIIRGLSEFQNNYFASHQELFASLSNSQSPEILFITCCDSRIAPALLTQTQPGELFIIRNLGNIIPAHGHHSSSEGAAIEYAVKVAESSTHYCLRTFGLWQHESHVEITTAII